MSVTAFKRSLSSVRTWSPRSETSAAGARPRAQHPWVAALPTGIFVALAWAMAWQARGSILSVDWLGYAILGAAVLAGVLLVGPALRPSRPAALALASLVGLAAGTRSR